MFPKAFSQVYSNLNRQSLTVLDPSISKVDFVPIDLSISNKELQSIDVSSSELLGDYINKYMVTNRAKVAYGGYLEKRNIYNRSDYFNASNPETERNIHLGLDLWIAAGTSIYAPLDSTIHSFKNNTNFGDYGPTIILEHELNNVKFYTLYGHLSLESIENLRIGQEFKQGQQIGTLGDVTVNGDYPPHLHFQMIKDMQHYVGDYPGVCSKLDLEMYKKNGFDPTTLFHLL